MLHAQAVKTPFLSFADTTGSQNFFYKSVTKTDGSGNIYVAGATVNGSGNRDLLLAKYNAAGNLQWIEQYDGAAHAEDFATALYIDGSGNVFVTGAVTTNTTTSLPDLATIKYNSSGVQQWLSTFDGSGSSYDAGADITLDGSGNVYVTGGAYNATPNSDIVTLKYNSSGAQQWANQFDPPTHHDDAGLKLSVSGSTVTVSVGSQSATAAYRFGVFKYAAATGSITGSSLTSTVTTAVNLITDMATDASGNIFLSGAVPTMSNGYDMYLIKFNSSLAVQWQQTYNGASNLDDVANGIATDASGNLYVSGYVSTASQGKDFVTQKYNSSGSLQWTQSYNSDANGDDAAADITLDNSGNVYSTGYKASDINGADYYTVKYDGSGTRIWDIQSDFSHQPDMAMGLVIDTLGNVVVTGQTQTAPGTYKYYTVKYIEKDVITPTDYNGEVPADNFLYYANRGQVVDTAYTPVPDVKFYTNYTSPKFYIEKNSFSFVFSKIDTVASTADTLQRIDLTHKGVNTSAKTYPLNEQESYLNYFLGYLPAPVTGVFGNQRLVTTDLYSNIDLVYSSNQHGIKLYYIVKPGGNPADIQLEFSGASSYSLNGSSNALSINSAIGSLTFDRPTAYQLTTGNATVAVTGWTPDWTTNGASNKYKFNLGSYTSSLTLVIEVDEGNAAFSIASNQSLKWSTYLGDAGNDEVNNVKTDVNNNLFAIGETSQNSFPGSNAGIYSSNFGMRDATLTKFDASDKLLWSTYMGGTRDERLTGVDFAPNGDIYAVGSTNSDNLSLVSKSGAYNGNAYAGPHSNTWGWETDGFVFQLDQGGLNNPWLIYYGGNAFDFLTGCKFDRNGNLFVIGYSASTDISNVTPTGAYNHVITNNSGGSGDYLGDGIIVKFDASSNINWSTYIGSTDGDPGYYPYDYLYDLDFVAGVDLVVVGSSQGNDYPVYHPGTQYYNSTGNNAVISRFSNTGQMQWSTYYDGGQADVAYSVLCNNGLTYVGGVVYSTSSGIHTVSSPQYYYQGTSGGVNDGLFLVFDEDDALFHASYIGGSGSEFITDIEMDGHGNLYFAGSTSSSDFPAPSTNPANTYYSAYNGSGDNFICALAQGGISWFTCLGGTNTEASSLPFFGAISGNDKYSASICINGNDNLFFGGKTSSSETQLFPRDPESGPPVYFQNNMAGTNDGSITKFDLVPVITAGVKENSAIDNSILVYPNPTSTLLNVQLNDQAADLSYRIYDNLGRVIAAGKCPNRFNTISVSSLSNGIYFLELYNARATYSAKFIKHD